MTRDPHSSPDTDTDPDTGTDTDERGERSADALIAALIELERHVGENGWDAEPRLFALVHTDELIAAEPALAAQQHLRGSADGAHPDALTAVEQDQFSPSNDLIGDLASIVWPPTVFGCALSLESSFLPADAEVDLPEDPAEARRVVAEHERRQDIRMVIGVTRDGHGHGVGRLVSQPDELLGAPDLVPGLVSVLAHTLAEPEGAVEAEFAAGSDGEHESEPDSESAVPDRQESQ